MNNTVLSSLRGYHYQILLGVYRCFDLDDNQSIWFERDGDISLRSPSPEDSEQIESKHYSDPLTDHHKNFWNTLNNWLKDEFHHKDYAYLFLHTTQDYGEKTNLKDWNDKNSEEKLAIIKNIYDSRDDSEKSEKEPTGVLKLQQQVLAKPEEKLKEVLNKVVINDNADNLEELAQKIKKRPTGIPENNLKLFFEGLIGFVYSGMKEETWGISGRAVREKIEELTSIYAPEEAFTFPQFYGQEASQSEIIKYEDALFVKKIEDINYEEQIPEAVGNYAELTNSLLENLHNSPLYKEGTQQYKNQLINKFRRSYISFSISQPHLDKIAQAKLLYNTVIDEPPIPMQGINTVPQPYKNGLIHDAMNEEDQNLKWEID